MMKSQFRRRFSLQPSSLTERREESPSRNVKNERLSGSESGHRPADGPLRHRIVMMGAAEVGKSAIINQFLYNTFSPKYKSTVEEMHHGEFNVSGIQLSLDILDTSGYHKFPTQREVSIRSADALVLVYDVNDVSTFKEVESLRNLILSIKGTVPIVIVGNKTDLVLDDEQEQNGKIRVNTARTKELVVNEWKNGFVEVSAKENINISQIFKELFIQANVNYNLSPALRRRRRESLPPPRHINSRSSNAHVPSPEQLQHLQQIRERSEGKRNSCILS